MSTTTQRIRLEELGELVSVERLRYLFDPPLGRTSAYEWARRHGLKIGGRLYVPRRVIEELVRGGDQ